MMNEKGSVHVSMSRTLVSVLLALALLQGTVLAASAPPPTWTPPEIYKVADKTQMAIGDQVQFTVTVSNPANPQLPLVPVTWYDVEATDVISPAFQIDSVAVTGSYDSYNVVGNTVEAMADTLAPGEWFVITIHCTLVGPADPGDSIPNYATLDYEDETGEPGDPIDSDTVTITVITGPPPTWNPPEIYKVADKTHLGFGRQVEFTVSVVNPANPQAPLVPVTWYDVHATDIISPAFQIDSVAAAGSYDSYSVVGNTVVAVANTLAPGEWFAVTIICTLVGPADPGQPIPNAASVDYENATGQGGVTIDSNTVTVTPQQYRVFLPITYRLHEP